MTHTASPGHVKDKRTIAGIIIMASLGVLLFFLVTGFLVKGLVTHDWALGFAPQQGSDNIQKIDDALAGIASDAIIDTGVENANTSGTPFGHSMRISVLYDPAKLSEGETEATLTSDIIDAVIGTGVKDSYTLFLAPTTNPRYKNTDGTEEAALTSVDDPGFRMSATITEF